MIISILSLRVKAATWWYPNYYGADEDVLWLKGDYEYYCDGNINGYQYARVKAISYPGGSGARVQAYCYEEFLASSNSKIKIHSTFKCYYYGVPASGHSWNRVRVDIFISLHHWTGSSWERLGIKSVFSEEKYNGAGIIEETGYSRLRTYDYGKKLNYLHAYRITVSFYIDAITYSSGNSYIQRSSTSGNTAYSIITGIGLDYY